MSSSFLLSTGGCISWELTGLCSGRGRCLTSEGNETYESGIPNSYCDCDSGWTGKGHLINLHNYDCGVHIPTTTTLHLLCLCFYLYAFLYAIVRCYEFIQSEKKKHLGDASFWTVLRGVWNYQMFINCFLVTVMCLCYFAIQINQLQGIYIGQTIQSGFFYVLYLGSFVSASVYYYRLSIQLTLALVFVSMDQNEKNRVESALKSHIPHSIFIVAYLLLSIPLFTVGCSKNLEIKNLCTCIWASGWGFFIFVYMREYVNGNIHTAKVLREGGRNDFIQQVQRRVVSERLTKAIKQLYTNMFIALVFYETTAFWPWFRTLTSYFMPILWSFVAITAILLMRAFAHSDTVQDSTLEIFYRITSDQEGLKALSSFLEREFSLENLKFWKRVEEYRKISPHAENEGTESPQLQFAKLLYDEFIQNEVINIPYEIRESLITWHQKVNSTDPQESKEASSPSELIALYNAAQLEIYLLLKSDSLRRFLRTKEYEDLEKRWASTAFLDHLLPPSYETAREPEPGPEPGPGPGSEPGSGSGPEMDGSDADERGQMISRESRYAGNLRASYYPRATEAGVGVEPESPRSQPSSLFTQQEPQTPASAIRDMEVEMSMFNVQ